MRKAVCFFALLILVVFSAAAAEPVLTILNETGYTICRLYISSADSEKWEEDVLGNTLVGTGESVKITLPSRGLWDIKAIDEDGDAYIIFDIKINGNKTVVIDADNLEMD